MHYMYLYVSNVYACMLIISYLYVIVLNVLAQTSSLPAITWQNDLLLGWEHAGPTQGRPGQVPIRFFPPSEDPPRPVLAIPRAQHGSRGSNSGPAYRQ